MKFAEKDEESGMLVKQNVGTITDVDEDVDICAVGGLAFIDGLLYGIMSNDSYMLQISTEDATATVVDYSDVGGEGDPYYYGAAPIERNGRLFASGYDNDEDSDLGGNYVYYTLDTDGNLDVLEIIDFADSDSYGVIDMAVLPDGTILGLENTDGSGYETLLVSVNPETGENTEIAPLPEDIGAIMVIP